VPAKGELAIELAPNTFLWVEMSDEFVEITRALLADRRITISPASTFAYFIDGVVLSLPLAKRPLAKGYRKPHWLPVYLRPAGVGTNWK
jgi:hypothetical protein